MRLPVMLGSPVLDGMSAAMRLVAGEVADTDPAVLVAVTTTRSVEPTSALTSERTASVSSEMSLQSSPVVLQSSHWYS